VIASIRGTVLVVSPDSAVLEVGGVGLSVLATSATLAELRIGHEAVLFTSLVVREDSLTLYAFADTDERAVFEAVQAAQGIGPKVAQAVLATHTPDAVRRAIAAEDVAALTRVPGIGRKGAERMIIDLKDRLGAPLPGTAGRAPTPGPDWARGVRQALAGLGYAPREVDLALTALEEDPPADVGTGLRHALAVLRRG
jgi:Holliday junction DNA helicase RuvA